MPILTSGRTDRGKVRQANEDFLGTFPERSLFIVADGMGGHKAGNVASRLAVETIVQAVQGLKTPAENRFEQISHYLDTAIQKANLKIFQEGVRNSDWSGMGTTVVVAWLHGNNASIGFVGDSRAYLLRKNNLRQVTTDHTVVHEYVIKGLIQPEEAERHPMKHVLSRALGTQEAVETDILNLPLFPGDILLLCSDGLTNMLTKDEMESILTGPGDLDDKSGDMIRVANEKGGKDNITLILVQYFENPV